MQITKFGHCCLLIEENGKRILTDPGSYTVDEQSSLENLDLILITHEHRDHLHVDSLKIILEKNPKALVVTNSAVGKLLKDAGVGYGLLEGTELKEFGGILLEAHDCKHEEIFEEYGQVQNTGYFIGPRLFYPGDAFYNPGKPVEILALPVAGPWARVRDAMRYVLEVKPKVCFPVHDGALRGDFGSAHRVPATVLPKFGIVFKSFAENKTEEF